MMKQKALRPLVSISVFFLVKGDNNNANNRGEIKQRPVPESLVDII